MIIGQKKIFASTLTYQLGREVGIERAARAFQHQLDNPNRNSLPVVRVFARLSHLGEVQVYHGSSTTLPKARSRAAHEALKSEADFWLMCDDDVECDSSTLVRLLDLAGQEHAAVLPCLMRGAGSERETVNVQFDADAVLQVHSTGAAFKACRRGGTGMMVLSRAALALVTQRTREELGVWKDDDGQIKVPLFQLMLSEVNGDAWFGEDFSFCERLWGAGVELRALLKGTSMHAGEVLNLEAIR
jgi:hypothetical protein